MTVVDPYSPAAASCHCPGGVPEAQAAVAAVGQKPPPARRVQQPPHLPRPNTLRPAGRKITAVTAVTAVTGNAA